MLYDWIDYLMIYGINRFLKVRDGYLTHLGRYCVNRQINIFSLDFGIVKNINCFGFVRGFLKHFVCAVCR